jgi:hypothetical protein
MRYIKVSLVAVVVAVALPGFARTAPAAPETPQEPEIHSRVAGGQVADLPARYRRPVCAGPTQYRSIAVYARAADSPDRYWSTVDDVRYAVMRANSFVHDEARRGGVDRMDFKFECTKHGEVSVVNAVLRTSAQADSFETIEYDLRALGLRDARVKYWVWYDGGVPNGTCGEARRPGDGALSETNPANIGGHHAIAYASTTACGSVASTLLHEASHTLGAVDPAAWGTDRHGHCVDGLDIMCSSGRLCPTTRYDCGNDTYFDPHPTKGEYLYSHWNLAFCVNRFISRTGCITHPRNLRASYSGYGVTLRWSAPSSSGGAPLAMYEIHRRTCGDCPWNVHTTVSGSRTSYTDTNLGFRYSYRVRAVNVWKDGGPLSNIASGGFL